MERIVLLFMSLILLFGLLFLAAPVLMAEDEGGGHVETAGNNLSFPVIWAEGISKTLRGTEGMLPELAGEWWYWWGTDSTGDPLSCQPHTDDLHKCSDGSSPGEGAIKVYLQKDDYNLWQAHHEDGGGSVDIDMIDWGDNLESVDWFLKSMVRVEVVLYKNLDAQVKEYSMRHLWGWGMDEMHGVATNDEQSSPVAEEGPGESATVYSHCAQLTIQKFADEEQSVSWDAVAEQWTGPIGEPLLQGGVWEADDGRAYYSAEVNIKGKVIFGYTWKVENLNAGEGLYRITFNISDNCGGSDPGAEFTVDTTILEPVEEGDEAEVVALSGTPSDSGRGGGTAVIDYENNLSYIDVMIWAAREHGSAGNR